MEHLGEQSVKISPNMGKRTKTWNFICGAVFFAYCEML